MISLKNSCFNEITDKYLSFNEVLGNTGINVIPTKHSQTDMAN